MSCLKNIIARIPFNNNKAILAGNTLEFFDLYLYIHFAVMISQKFFPTGFEKTTFFQSFTFCQIYFLAPIACLIFSYLGDKHGRKPVILHTSMLMAVTSLLITFLPTYETCGETATVLLVILRVIQGVALAGEPTAANLYLVESSSMNRDDPWYKQAPWYISLMSATEELGGLFALGIGYLSLHLWSGYSHGWRAPFACCAVFVFVILFIRSRLSESEDYREATSNKESVNIFQGGKKGFLYFQKTLGYYKRNVICRILLLLIYPVVFNICFLQISPKVVGEGAKLEDLLLYNLSVSIGSLLCGLTWTYFPLRFKWDLRKTVTKYVMVGCICAFAAVWCLENNMPMPVIRICQILMISLINFGLILPGILKVFPVLIRYRLMALGWGTARFMNFFLMVFGLQAVKSILGLYGCLYLLYGLVALALFATWYHVSYYTIDGQSIWDAYKQSRKGKLVPVHVMTLEEVDRYVGETPNDPS